jgi:hypothetical protein
MSTPMASRLEPQDAQHPRTRKRRGSMNGRGCDNPRSTTLVGHVHGSGVRLPHLSNLCLLPAWIRLLISPASEIIPHIFRILDISAVTARTLQGMARVRSGQAPAWPLSSGRSVRSGSRVKRDFACTVTGSFPPVLVALRAESRLRLEGRTRTISGPSPDLTSSVSDLPGALVSGLRLRGRGRRRGARWFGVW